MLQNKLIKIVSLFAALTVTQNSYAGLFIFTPSVGFKNQTINITNNSSVDSEAKMSDPVYGLKLGMQTIAGVGIEAAGSYSAGKAKIITAGVETQNDYTHKIGAVQLSVSANLFKIYLGYILYNELAVTGNTPGTSMKFTGPGYQAGLALNLTQSISLGVQYEIHQFNKVNMEAVGTDEDIKTYFKKFDSQSLSANLSYSF